MLFNSLERRFAKGKVTAKEIANAIEERNPKKVSKYARLHKRYPFICDQKALEEYLIHNKPVYVFFEYCNKYFPKIWKRPGEGCIITTPTVGLILKSEKWRCHDFSCTGNSLFFAVMRNNGKPEFEQALLNGSFLHLKIHDYLDSLEGYGLKLDFRTAGYLVENVGKLLENKNFSGDFRYIFEYLPEMPQEDIDALGWNILKSGHWPAYVTYCLNYPTQYHEDYILAHLENFTPAFSTDSFLTMCGNFLHEIVALESVPKLIIKLMGSVEWVVETVIKHGSLNVILAYFRENEALVPEYAHLIAKREISATQKSVACRRSFPLAKAFLVNGIGAGPLAKALPKRFIRENSSYFLHPSVWRRWDIPLMDIVDDINAEKELLLKLEESALTSGSQLPSAIEFLLAVKGCYMKTYFETFPIRTDFIFAICLRMSEEEKLKIVSSLQK